MAMDLNALVLQRMPSFLMFSCSCRKSFPEIEPSKVCAEMRSTIRLHYELNTGTTLLMETRVECVRCTFREARR